MLVSDFSFDLPDESIARYPAPERDASRLLVLDRTSQTVSERLFGTIDELFHPGDLLVLNDTRVIPARIPGHKESGGKVEIFLVRQIAHEHDQWECLLKGAKRFRPGQPVLLAGGMSATVLGREGEESWRVRFSGNEPFSEWLEREGHMPLPPYLKRGDNTSDRERYQTVFARSPGAVAAPTAGLHFTEELLGRIALRGVEIARVTLHTGLGTFQPVRVERVEDHRIHAERYKVCEDVVQAVAAARKRKGRVIAVGTTTTRTLEFAADGRGGVAAGSGEASLFIYPGFRFSVVDAMITNFHLPESTLLMMVSAFAGRDFVLGAYRQAVRDGFRFYSYGDAMLIV